MLLGETAGYGVTDNDLYHLEVVGSHVVTNDNYAGLLVLDKELSLVERVRLFPGITIYSSFTDHLHGVAVLYCPDNDRLVHVDLERGTHAAIALKGKLRQGTLSDLYAWVPNGLIVSTYGGAFYCVDVSRRRIRPMQPADIARELPAFYEFWMQAAHDPRRREVFPGEFQYVAVDEERQLVHVCDYRKGQWHTAHTGDYWPHEVLFREGTFLLVHEQQISVCEAGREGAVLASTPYWQYLRGRFLPGSHADRIGVLSTDDRDPLSSMITAYDIVR